MVRILCANCGGLNGQRGCSYCDHGFISTDMLDVYNQEFKDKLHIIISKSEYDSIIERLELLEDESRWDQLFSLSRDKLRAWANNALKEFEQKLKEQEGDHDQETT